MKTRVLLVLMAFGALIAAAALSIASAHAEPVGDTSPAFAGYAGDQDPYSIWEDVRPFGTSALTADIAGRFGQGVCSRLQSGTSEGQLINWGVTQFGVDFNAARYVIHAAEWHYCPSYY